MDEELFLVENLLLEGCSDEEIIEALTIEADLKSKMPIFIKQFTKKGIKEEEAKKKVEEANTADPTGNKANYTQWIIKMLLNGKIRFPEDIDKVKETLVKFDKVKKNPNAKINKDIMSYKEYADLLKALESLAPEEEKSKGERKRQEVMEGTKEVYKDDTYTVIELMNTKAGHNYCYNRFEDGGQWCFKDERWAQNYLDMGDNIFVIEKNDKPYLAFHLASRQLKDTYDYELSLDDERWAEVYPILKELTGVIVLELEDEIELVDEEEEPENE